MSKSPGFQALISNAKCEATVLQHLSTELKIRFRYSS